MYNELAHPSHNWESKNLWSANAQATYKDTSWSWIVRPTLNERSEFTALSLRSAYLSMMAYISFLVIQCHLLKVGTIVMLQNALYVIIKKSSNCCTHFVTTMGMLAIKLLHIFYEKQIAPHSSIPPLIRNLIQGQVCIHIKDDHIFIVNHDSGFIIGIAMIFCKNSNRTYT